MTVVVGLLASGNSSTLRPLASVYCVTPSTVGPWTTPGGSAACAASASAAAPATIRVATARRQAAGPRAAAGLEGVGIMGGGG